MAEKSRQSLLERNKHLLYVLLGAKSKFRQEILKHCDESLIKLLDEILHNLLKGNVKVSENDMKKLKRHKTSLRNLNNKCRTTKCLKQKRKLFVKQIGGNPLLSVLGVAGRFLLPMIAEKIGEYGISKMF